MNCKNATVCGGCKYRHLEETEYRALKEKMFKQCLAELKDQSYKLNNPVYICDGCRRRVSFAFEYKKKKLVLGFNREASTEIIDIEECPLADAKINGIIPQLKKLILSLCQEVYNERQGKKIIQRNINSGDVFVCTADNGLDIVLEFQSALQITHRMIISEFCNAEPEVIRVSHRQSSADEAETIVEKVKPYVKMGNYEIYVPAGTFLQPSKQGQETLGNLVLKYLKDVKGHIADLFCGVGTFSYLLAQNPSVKITAADSSKSLLQGFKESVCKNRITNIDVINKNLFKYPFSAEELKDFTAVVFDPPRAGAKAVCRELAKAAEKPERVVAISCNPHTFINDANTLIEGGYKLCEITMVDQFIYSNHSELVAFFTK